MNLPEGGVDLATPPPLSVSTLCDRGSHRGWGLKEPPPPFHLVNILAARRCQAFTWIKEISGKLLSADPSYLLLLFYVL